MSNWFRVLVIALAVALTTPIVSLGSAQALHASTSRPAVSQARVARQTAGPLLHAFTTTTTTTPARPTSPVLGAGSGASESTAATAATAAVVARTATGGSGGAGGFSSGGLVGAASVGDLDGCNGLVAGVVCVNGDNSNNKLFAFVGVGNQSESIIIFDAWHPNTEWWGTGVCHPEDTSFTIEGGIHPKSLFCSTAGVTQLHMHGLGGNDELVVETGGLSPISGIPKAIRWYTEMYGGFGNDLLAGGNFQNVLDGGPDTDSLHGGDANDSLYGGSGVDTLVGGYLDDLLDGGSEADTLFGEDGRDTLVGGTGNDGLVAGSQADTLFGGPNDDSLYGEAGPDDLWGDDGFDTVDYSSYPGPITVNIDGIDNDPDRDNVHASVELVIGTGKADTVYAGWAGTHFHGRGGDDEFIVAGGPDAFDGGQGSHDHVSFRKMQQPMTINLDGNTSNGDTLLNVEDVTATRYDDVIRGNDVANVLIGSGGADDVYGLGGFDELWGDIAAGHDDNGEGNAGDDLLDGGVGNDTLNGGDGLDALWGDADDDTLYGANGDDDLYGESGDDWIYGGIGLDHLEGGTENDHLFGEWDVDKLWGNAGDDELRGGPETDELRGGDNDDHLWGDEFPDFLWGEGGNDTLEGGNGADLVRGGGGDDTLSGSSDELYGEGDVDTITPEGGSFVDGGGGADVIQTRGGKITVGDDLYNDGPNGPYDNIIRDTISFDIVKGTDLADEFRATNLAHASFEGGGGNDVFYGDPRGDTFRGVASFAGGAGRDRVQYDTTLDVTAGIGNAGDGPAGPGARDFIDDMEDLWGGDGNDVLAGDNLANEIGGRRGDDRIYGYDGSDVLNGDFGNDVLYGGNGTELNSILNFFNGSGDVLVGAAGNDRLYGELGPDTLDGGIGEDYLDGGVPNALPDSIGDGAVDHIEAREFPGQMWTTGVNDGVVDTVVCDYGWNAADLDVAAWDVADNVIDCEAWGGLPFRLTPPSTFPRSAIALYGTIYDMRWDRNQTWWDIVEQEGKEYATRGVKDVLKNQLKRLLTYDIEMTDEPDGRVRIQDFGGALQPGNGCVQGVARNIVLCTRPGAVSLTLPEYDDKLRMKAAIPGTIDLGAGNDEVEASSARQTLNGGTGIDRVRYDRPAGKSVSLSFDGVANDGESGEGDNVVGFENFQGGAENDTVIDAATSTPQSHLRGGGGVDTLDYSKRTAAVVARLGLAGGGLAGENDDIGGDFENLIGGAGNDELRGNSVDNLLRGGPGSDVLDGLAGVDTLDYSDKFNGVAVSLTAGTAIGVSETDTLINSENVIGSNLADTITGNSAKNSLWGRSGADKLYGLGNDDLLYGEAGNDELYGGDGNDSNDGGPNADVIDGDAGVDWVSYAAATVPIRVSLDNTTNDDGADTNHDGTSEEKDKVLETEAVIGGQSYNRLIGDASDNFLWAPSTQGASPDAYIRGNGGKDWLIAGRGNDDIDGGEGADIINAAEGNDTITGGPGVDSFSGGPGSDSLHANDGVAETLLCGSEHDIVYADYLSNGIHDTWGNDCEEYQLPGWSPRTIEYGRWNGGGSATSRNGIISTARRVDTRVALRECRPSWLGCVWQPEVNLGGVLAPGSMPSINARGTLHLDVVIAQRNAQGENRVLWRCTPCTAEWGWGQYADISYDGTRTVTAAASSSPEVASIGTTGNDFLVLIKGTDGALWYRQWCESCGTQWQAWKRVAGLTLQDGVGAIGTAGYKTEIVAVGTDRRLHQIRFDCSLGIACFMGTWEDLGGVNDICNCFDYKPDIASSGPGSLDVVLLSELGAKLWWKIYRDGKWLPGKQLLSGNLIPPAITSQKPGELFLFTGSGSNLDWTELRYKEPIYG